MLTGYRITPISSYGCDIGITNGRKFKSNIIFGSKFRKNPSLDAVLLDGQTHERNGSRILCFLMNVMLRTAVLQVAYNATENT
jgi:hypothetical protein